MLPSLLRWRSSGSSAFKANSVFSGHDRREWFHSAILGLLNPFAYYLILFKAYDLLPAQEAQPLNYTWPIMLVLLSALILRQRIRAVSAAAILLSFAGVLIVSTRGDLQGFRFTNPAGAALALSSSILWALFWLFNVKDPRDEALKLFLCFAFGTVYTFAALVLFAPLRCIPVPGLLGACYIGLFEMGITFVLWLKALTLSRSTAQVSNLIYLSPFVSLFFITMTVGERSFFHGLGTVSDHGGRGSPATLLMTPETAPEEG